jgi:diguanylate cyclase (GGDEF)-like protein/PAS domain S-box-containing protein
VGHENGHQNGQQDVDPPPFRPLGEEGVVDRATGWWKAVVERSSDVLVAMDASGVVNYLSPSGARIFGWSESDLIGTSGFQYIHPDDTGRITLALETGLQGQPNSPYPTFRVRHQHGGWRHVEARGTNLLSDPEVGAFIISLRDVTERVEAEAAVRLRDEGYRNVVEGSPEAIVIHQDGIVVHANPAAMRLLGAVDRREIMGRDPAELLELKPSEVVPVEGLGTEVVQHVTAVDRHLHRIDGSMVSVELTSIPTIWDGFAATQVVARDMTEQRQADLTLVHLATHDPLTGLPNRSLLEDRLRHASARALRTRRPFAVLFVDLDRFKVVNDTLGHEKGDELLRQVAYRLSDAVRPGDTVARLGGDEFVIVVEDLLVTDTVDLVVERVLTSFDEHFTVAERDFHIGASVGVLVTAEGGDPRVLLRDADNAMYTAKTQGRGRAVRFDSALREQVHRHEELERRLRAALDEHQIFAALQPVVRLSDRSIVGVEALMRWSHPDRGVLLPEAFLGVADEAGLLVALGEQIIDLACAQAATWRSSRPSSDGPASPWLSVNVARSQLMHPGFDAQLLTILERHRMTPRGLVLELNEDSLLDDPIGTMEALAPLREAGVKLAIDDFGSGYTSLAALRRFSPDLLKVDRSLVSRMTESPSDAAMVRAVIHMGHALGVPVVAEGVELVEQQHLLVVLGCDLAQGFLFARPGDLGTIHGLMTDGHV